MKIPNYYKMVCQKKGCGKFTKIYLCECCETRCLKCLKEHIKKCETHKRKNE